MSILSELKRLTNKHGAKVISEALPDSMSGGNDAFFVVTASIDDDSHSTILDKTANEIIAARDSGKIIVCGFEGRTLLFLNAAVMPGIIGSISPQARARFLAYAEAPGGSISWGLLTFSNADGDGDGVLSFEE